MGDLVEQPDEVTRNAVAARDGDVAAVNALLDDGVDVNALLRNEWTALMIAALHNRPQVVSTLIRRGAYLDVRNAAGWSALTIAERKGYEKVAKLLRHGAPERARPRLLGLGAESPGEETADPPGPPLDGPEVEEPVLPALK